MKLTFAQAMGLILVVGLLTPGAVSAGEGPAPKSSTPSKQIPTIPLLTTNPTVDGTGQSWTATAANIDSIGSGTATTRDLRGQLKFAYTSEALYVFADIADRYPMTNSHKGNDIYNGDNIELCLSLDPNANPTRKKFEATDYQIGLCPGDGKHSPPSNYEWHALGKTIPAVTIMALKTSYGYTLEAKIPWNALSATFVPSSGMKLGFDIAIDVANSDRKRGYQWIWAGGSNFWQVPAVWSSAIFQ